MVKQDKLLFLKKESPFAKCDRLKKKKKKKKRLGEQNSQI